MKKFIILLALVAGAGTTFASNTAVDGIWYDFDDEHLTAEVTYPGDAYYTPSENYSGEVVIPYYVTYNDQTYSVTGIGYHAFRNCTDVTSVTIPGSVTRIGTQAFDGCSSLTGIDVTGGNYFCSKNGVLFSKDMTTLVVYPGGKQGAYTIPRSVTTIGREAFAYCRKLTSVTIPSSVTSIEQSAFWACSGLTFVTNYATTPQEIIPNVFNGGLDYSTCKLYVPTESVEAYKAAYVWKSFTNTVGIDVPEGSILVDGIAYLFNYGNLTAEVTSTIYGYPEEVVIPSSVTYNEVAYNVTSIGDQAFSHNSGLSAVTIPNSVTHIGDYAFGYCSGLTSVTIPSSVTIIGKGAFQECSNLTSMTIPDNVTIIGKGTFQDCSSLTSVTIPDNVTTIADHAFNGCRNLTSVEIPNSVTRIGDYAFQDCSALTSLIIPRNVTRIGTSAFQDCSALTSVKISANVTSIGTMAFAKCSGLTSVINYAATPQSINSSVFGGYGSDPGVDYSNCTLYVPEESIPLYDTAEGWSEFTNIVRIDPIETNEGNYAIYYVDKKSQDLSEEIVTLHVPVAPTITGFHFLRWETVAADLQSGITIQAIYQADIPSAAPAVYTNPANPAQKLIRNGNVYILTEDKTYSIDGRQVR